MSCSSSRARAASARRRSPRRSACSRADRGLRTIVVEVGEQARLPELFGSAGREPGAETQPARTACGASRSIPTAPCWNGCRRSAGACPGRVLASSSTFQYFAAAAPGAKELVSMVKIWDLTRRKRRQARRGYDLVVLDAPATGHALGMLGLATHVRGDRARGADRRTGRPPAQAAARTPTARVISRSPSATEMAITETLDLQQRLQRSTRARAGRGGRQRGAATALQRAGVAAPRTTTARREPTTARASATGARESSGRRASATAVRRSAVVAAHAVSERARFQHNQLARLRRRKFEVIGVPFQFAAELDLRRLAASPSTCGASCETGLGRSARGSPPWEPVAGSYRGASRPTGRSAGTCECRGCARAARPRAAS